MKEYIARYKVYDNGVATISILMDKEWRTVRLEPTKYGIDIYRLVNPNKKEE